jgi:hypothetical protein
MLNYQRVNGRLIFPKGKSLHLIHINQLVTIPWIESTTKQVGQFAGTITYLFDSQGVLIFNAF